MGDVNNNWENIYNIVYGRFIKGPLRGVPLKYLTGNWKHLIPNYRLWGVASTNESLAQDDDIRVSGLGNASTTSL